MQGYQKGLDLKDDCTKFTLFFNFMCKNICKVATVEIFIEKVSFIEFKDAKYNCNIF